MHPRLILHAAAARAHPKTSRSCSKRGVYSLLVMSPSLMAFSACSTTSRYIKSQDYGHVLIRLNNPAIGRVCEALTFGSSLQQCNTNKMSGSSYESFLSHCAAAARIAPYPCCICASHGAANARIAWRARSSAWPEEPASCMAHLAHSTFGKECGS